MKYLTKVKISTYLKRRGKHISEMPMSSGYNKFWVSEKLDKEKVGIVIGKRTLSNGIAEYYDEGINYRQSETFEALLISIDMKTNPIYVLPSEITELAIDKNTIMK